MNIIEIVKKIREAVFGIDVRESIADGIEAINNITESTKKRQESLEKSFNSLIINAGNSNAEIVDARGEYETLKYRLEAEQTNHESDISNIRKEVEKSNTDLELVLSQKIDDIKTNLNKTIQSMSENVTLWESTNGENVTGTILTLNDDISNYYDIVCVCDFNGYDYNLIVSNAGTLSLRGLNLADTPSLTSKSTEFYEIGLRKINNKSYEITRNNRIIVSSNGAKTKENDSEYSKLRKIYAKRKVTLVL